MGSFDGSEDEACNGRKETRSSLRAIFHGGLASYLNHLCGSFAHAPDDPQRRPRRARSSTRRGS
jgi:hypothetical protein